MIMGIRSTFVLVVSFIFFLIVVGMFGLSTVMRPGRWSERLRLAGDSLRM